MITGNTVRRLTSATPNQPTALPEGKEDDLYTRSDTQIQTLRPIVNRNRQSCQERSTVHQNLDRPPWRNVRHNRNCNTPIGQSSAKSRGGNVEDRRTQTRN